MGCQGYQTFTFLNRTYCSTFSSLAPVDYWVYAQAVHCLAVAEGGRCEGHYIQYYQDISYIRCSINKGTTPKCLVPTRIFLHQMYDHLWISILKSSVPFVYTEALHLQKSVPDILLRFVAPLSINLTATEDTTIHLYL